MWHFAHRKPRRGLFFDTRFLFQRTPGVAQPTSDSRHGLIWINLARRYRLMLARALAIGDDLAKNDQLSGAGMVAGSLDQPAFRGNAG
jgi:hypothetical protein